MLLIRSLLGLGDFSRLILLPVLLSMVWFLFGASDPTPLSAYFVVKLLARVWEGLRDLLRFVPLLMTFALFLIGYYNMISSISAPTTNNFLLQVSISTEAKLLNNQT